MTILPKITAAVSSWNPTTDRTPIDKWVVPWVRVLGHSISSVFPEIRRKISKALGGWEATDHSAYWVLSPWIGERCQVGRVYSDAQHVVSIVDCVVLYIRHCQRHTCPSMS